MTFDVLSADGEDARRWTGLVRGLAPEHRDIHLLPEYGRIYRRTHGVEPLLAVHQAADGYVLQPFVRRPLAGLPFLAETLDRDRFFDIANAYGYGGPLSNLAEPNAARGLYGVFADQFASWCEAEGIASEFASLHPLTHDFQRSLIDGRIETGYEKDVVIIDLHGDEEEIARGLRKGHRSSITLARRRGATVEKVAATPENLRLFSDVYTRTMERRDAAERWFLPMAFFADTAEELGPERTSLLFATVDGALESGCMVIHDFDTAYYHFAGTYALHPDAGVNNLLVWEAAMQAKRDGYKRLYLGGGVTRDGEDSLLRFKAGFSKQRAPLYTYFTIRNSAVYDDLSERKIAFEQATLGHPADSSFLPLYRR